MALKKPVWQSDAKGTPDSAFVSFAAGRDVVGLPPADRVLVPYDIWTNQAHARGLYEIQVYSLKELQSLMMAFNRLEDAFQSGKWKLDPKLEDVHINIEAYINKTCGSDIGGRLHTGRSRNDQVATDMKLYAREVLLQFAEEVHTLIASINRHAKINAKTVMPGYTHHRKATVTSWGHWCASYSQGLMRDAQRLVSLYHRLNISPLGAAASYGTTWDLQRLKVAKWLGFDGLQENTLDAIVSRGETEADLAFALSMLLKRLSVISQDIILFSTEEFGYFKLPTEMTTGSSIMPQKRNPDFAEAIKGKFHVVQGFANSLLTMNAGNQSGYNKDVQWSKYVFLDAVRESFGAASMLVNVFDQLNTNKQVMKQAAERGFLNAVDFADFLAASRDIAFRKTYTILSEAVGKAQSDRFEFNEMNEILDSHSIVPLSRDEFNNLNDPMKCLLSRPHAGSPNPEQVLKHIKQLNSENQNLKKWINQTRRKLLQAKRRCEQL